MIRDLEAALGYTFQNITLLQNALAHSSYANERWQDSLKSNERLEFLGDSILGMVVAQHLFAAFPDRPEGDLTRMRADMVCETSLACVAEQIGLGQHILLGKGEEQGGGRNRPSILADATEAIIAASFLDGGMDAARGIIKRFFLCNVPAARLNNMDYKTLLQEQVQKQKDQALTYTMVGATGPDHDKTFIAEVSLNGVIMGRGEGSSKKRAEQEAARVAIEKLAVEK